MLDGGMFRASVTRLPIDAKVVKTGEAFEAPAKSQEVAIPAENL